MITEFKIFENKKDIDNYANLVGQELYDYFSLEELKISELLSDYRITIETYFNNGESEYACAEELLEKEYLIKYHDHHTAIYNVLVFKYKEDAIFALKIIDENKLNIDFYDDMDILNINLSKSNIEYTNNEINYREIKEIDGKNYIYDMIILDESDIIPYERKVEIFKKKQTVKDFNL